MRKNKTIAIQIEGRDKGKHFLVEEMSAWDIDRWGRKAIVMLANAGVDIGAIGPASGIAGIVAAGIANLNKLKEEQLGPLMDEMLFKTVKVVPDPHHPEYQRGLKPEDIEEVSTILELRAEAMNIHVGFLPAVSPSTSIPSTTSETAPKTRLTRTRPARSGPLLHGRRAV